MRRLASQCLFAAALLASVPAFAQDAEEPPPEGMRASESRGGFHILRALVTVGGVGLMIYAQSIRSEEPTDSTIYLGTGAAIAVLGLGSMLCPSGDSRYSSADNRVVVGPVVLPKGAGAAVAIRF